MVVLWESKPPAQTQIMANDDDTFTIRGPNGWVRLSLDEVGEIADVALVLMERAIAAVVEGRAEDQG